MAATNGLKVGDRAPAFQAPASPGGKKIRLSQFKGERNVVLYFYPRDNTPGCTTEACDFRDASVDIDASNAVILGASTDSIESHEKFTGKFELPFPLLADENHEIAEKYGVWVEKNMYGKKSMGILRSTFLIDKQGRIARIWRRVKVDGHVKTVIEALTELG